ncbi:FAD/NAD(P)-binding domain-containing protein [Aspergillus alliaceus]|uniref:FAD/NAD(P)-binding domain-containing protein n=1 Tax=Petromyces alliaceus TaxID=209559 RepID=A0A5N7CJV2_PETAA|nr:FAD/NAD(P)-binding domain-containing protein [Aspergillus alliaceus]
MAAPVVLIIGCGIAGPVLGIFYKRQGYHPIVFEKVQTLGDAGASLMLMPNGMKVLNLIGIADQITKESLPLTGFWDGISSGETLGQSGLPSAFTAKYGQPAVGIKRTSISLMLKMRLLEMGVELREGCQLVKIEEGQDSVTAVFNGGQRVTGAFLIGCDGIKAASRHAMLGIQGIPTALPSFTGLIQSAGISPTPQSLDAFRRGSLCNWYGDGVHVIAYPISPALTSWAITLPESQDQEETWRVSDPSEIEAQREALAARLTSFEPIVLDLIKTATRIVKYGLFDREELRPEQWYSKRCVLVGDAAHPTSPHLGQGANQALEDCYHLIQLMPFLDTSSGDYTKEWERISTGLPSFFKAYAEKRQPRTSALVNEARAVGERRVVTGGSALCRERDAVIAKSWSHPDIVMAKYDRLFKEPF